MYSIKFLAAAKTDLKNPFEWYNGQKSNLGTQFFQEVEKTLTIITENPFLYPIRFSGIFRFALLKRFPFLIVYSIEKDVVYINSIFHTSRNPNKF